MEIGWWTSAGGHHWESNKWRASTQPSPSGRCSDKRWALLKCLICSHSQAQVGSSSQHKSKLEVMQRYSFITIANSVQSLRICQPEDILNSLAAVSHFAFTSSCRTLFFLVCLVLGMRAGSGSKATSTKCGVPNSFEKTESQSRAKEAFQDAYRTCST